LAGRSKRCSSAPLALLSTGMFLAVIPVQFKSWSFIHAINITLLYSFKMAEDHGIILTH
jgi:hypothetical protein